MKDSDIKTKEQIDAFSELYLAFISKHKTIVTDWLIKNPLKELPIDVDENGELVWLTRAIRRKYYKK